MKEAIVAVGLALVLLVTAAILAGCATSEVETPDVTAPAMTVYWDVGGRVKRFVDSEAGVVCWVYDKALECLPLEDTTLQVSP